MNIFLKNSTNPKQKLKKIVDFCIWLLLKIKRKLHDLVINVLEKYLHVLLRVILMVLVPMGLLTVPFDTQSIILSICQIY